MDIKIDGPEVVELLRSKPRQFLVDPELAHQLLALSKGNRPLSKSRVATYARDMKNRDWPLGDQPIGFHRDGWLANGHHRLEAVIAAEIPVRFRFIYDLTDEDVRVIDQGRPRRLSDHVSLFGEKNMCTLSSCARVLAIFARRDHSAAISSNELDRIISAHPNIRESVALCMSVRQVGSSSIVAAIHYIGKYFQGEDVVADKYVEVLKSGIPAYPKDPAHLVRERIIREKSKHLRLSTPGRINLLLNAWLLFRKGQQISKVTIPSSIPSIPGWNESVLRRGSDG